MSNLGNTQAPTLILTDLPNGLVLASGQDLPREVVVITWPDGGITSVMTQANGSYSAVSPHIEGSGSIKAYSIDMRGAQSPTASVNYIPPSPPVILTADLDHASDSGISNSDHITNDNTPTIKGTGEAGSTISMPTPTGEYLTTTVAANGTWSLTPTVSILDGVIHFVVTEETIAGATTNSAVTVTVDTIVPDLKNLVTIDMDANNDGIISAAEKGSATTSPVTIAFDGTQAKVGDVMHIRNDQGIHYDVILTAADIAAGKVVTSVDVGAAGTTVGVHAYVTDIAGNGVDSSGNPNPLEGFDTALVEKAIPVDHAVTGREDTAFVFQGYQFGATANTTAIVIDSLPQDGTLKLNGYAVSVGQSISMLDVNSGHLIFMPDANESGFDWYHNAGLGNMKDDYAAFGFHEVAGGSAQVAQTMTVDILPVADKPHLSVLSNSWDIALSNGYIPPGHHKYEWLTPNGSVTNCFDKSATKGKWQRVQLSSPGSDDQDGSEHFETRVQINTKTSNPWWCCNKISTSWHNEVLLLDNGTILHKDADGLFTLPAGTKAFNVFGADGYDNQLHTWLNTTQSVDITATSKEENNQGDVFDTAQTCAHVELRSPLVLDLTGNGVHTTSIANGTQFDLNADGVKEQTGWTASGQGILAMDLNHDGKIDSGKELFGDHTVKADGTTAKDGYDALSMYDSNHDGVIDAKDVHFKDLLVWLDANHDGISQASELHSLADLHIASISLKHANDSTEENGNRIDMSGSFTTNDGKAHAMADAYFNTVTYSASVTSASTADVNHDAHSAHSTTMSSMMQSLFDPHAIAHAFI